MSYAQFCCFMSCRTKQLNTNTRAWAANVAGSQFALHFCVTSPDHPHSFHLTTRIRRKDHVTVPPDFLDLQAFLLRFARFRAASHARHSEKIFPLNPRTTPIFFRHTRQRLLARCRAKLAEAKEQAARAADTVAVTAGTADTAPDDGAASIGFAMSLEKLLARLDTVLSKL